MYIPNAYNESSCFREALKVLRAQRGSLILKFQTPNFPSASGVKTEFEREGGVLRSGLIRQNGVSVPDFWHAFPLPMPALPPRLMKI